MKYSEQTLKKVNDLLSFNQLVASIYLKVSNHVKDKQLKSFFKERVLERNYHAKSLRKEIEKLDIPVNIMDSLDENYYEVLATFRSLVIINDNRALLEELENLKRETINRYNDLLMEFNLPLNLCRKLIKQRDSVEYSISVLKRESVFVD